jgi:hypothetical protein
MTIYLFLLTQAPSLEDKILFQSDKIYTVLAVILLIWVGIIVQLLLIEKKIKRLEQEIKNMK